MITTQVGDGITRTLTYDGLDHLVRWSSSVNGQEEWNLYDASGERVLQRTYDGSKTAITVYAFGTEEHEYSYSGSGSSATNTSNTYYYTLGGQELALWDGTSPTTNFLLTDTLGSVVSTFNNLPNGGAVVLGDQAYGPYGNKRVQQGTLSTSKGFTGQYSDFLTGLDYYGARYYDPVTGVFLSADKKQGNMQGIDPYSYVGGNPKTRIDPSGQRWLAPDGSTAWINPVSDTLYVQEAPNLEIPQGWLNTYQLSLPYHPDTGNDSTLAKLGRATGLSTITNPKASVGDKIKAGLHGINNLVTAAGILLAGPEVEAGDGLIEGGDELLNSVEDAASACEGGLSFIPTTKVATKYGEQAIGTLKVGEKVWAYNPSTKKMELQPILHVWINHDHDLVDLTITSKTAKGTKPTNEVLHTNKKHPFLTVEKGFLPVGQIKLGMHVVEASGQTGMVSGWKVVPGVKTMYNLEVAQDHTYTVGVGQWVVHNCEIGLPEGNPPNGWEIEPHDDGPLSFKTDMTPVGMFTRGNALANLYRDGELSIGWVDKIKELFGVRSLVNWLGDSVQSIKAYPSAEFEANYFATPEQTQETLESLDKLASHVGFERIEVPDASKLELLFRKI